MGILYYGDNLEILRNKIDDESVDLCYIDPPFNSNRNYFQIYNNIGGEVDKAQAQAFVDTWQWDPSSESAYEQIITNFEGRFTRQAIELIKGMELVLQKKNPMFAYIVSMTTRLTEIFRVLKPSGAFYLHCDSTASHYLKLVLDSIFCSQGGDFRNEIIWHYGQRLMHNKYKFNKKHDNILFYSKSRKHVLNPVTTPWTKEDIVQARLRKIQIDEDGREYIWDNRSVSKGYEPKKQYIEDIIEKGKAIDDVWDIPMIVSTSRERMGYPTQKPEALLERIITASSNEGDLVLDAYCGCGTTVAVAQRLKRNWIGIDITFHSISLILKRMADSFGENVIDQMVVDGIPKDVDSAKALATREDDRTRKEFEKWAVLTYTNNRGVINTKKGADKGIDGIVYFASSQNTTERMIIQVKSGGANRGTIATLRGDMEREKAQLATLITLDEPTRAMKDEAINSGFYHHPIMGRDYERIQIVTVQDLIEKKKRLELPLSFDVIKSAQKKVDDSQLGLF